MTSLETILIIVTIINSMCIVKLADRIKKLEK